MPSIYRRRRPRASPLWQIIHHAWEAFRRDYESLHRKTHGPLRKDAIAVVDQFYKCGDLAAGFTRLQCPDCGHEKLPARISQGSRREAQANGIFCKAREGFRGERCADTP